MAIYHGTFACGCEGKVNVTGPQKFREYKINKAFSGLCDTCYREELNKKREKDNKEALERAQEMELPTLTGTEKQISWATTLRQEFIDKVDKFISEPRAKEMWGFFQEEFSLKKLNKVEDVIIVLDYILENEIEAKYFIDNRDEKFLTLISKHIDNAIKTDEEIIAEDQFNDIKLEATIFPENAVTNVVTEIQVYEDSVAVISEKDYKIIEIVKSLGFKWEGRWNKNINEITGTSVDRATEVGNKLLNAGYPVMIMDKEIREKAIQGIYKAECNRWVMVRKDGEYKGRIAIKWWEKNDKLYEAARRLPGSKWSRGSVVVRVEHYKEIEEFAELYQFEFTKKAIKHIEEYKNTLKNIDIVKPVEVEKVILKDGLQEILNSSREVLDDLKD